MTSHNDALSKINAAKKQLESGRKNIHDIILDLGYTDLQAFRELFKRVAGMTPVEYGMKYEVVDGRG